ncbi:retrotransposon [Fusarium albosuccineum]|uniref:Retrotransposon n=1 Tax=Fusarium albosuccineum TaxID=1237068 RepID=A0A8H4KE79_9HYPO|nr:retrotransposon [Fusarium albosuccineum]
MTAQGPIHTVSTEEEFYLRLIIEDEAEDDINRILLALALLDQLNRRAPRPADHGDRVTQGELQHTNPALARAHAEWLLNAPEDIFSDIFRMKKAVFLALCRWLRDETDAGDSREMYLEQRVMIILWIFAFGEVQRNAARFFRVHQSTISRVFHDLIGPLRELHTRFVVQPRSGDLSPDVELDEDFMQFNGAIGALDGTHIRAFIPLRLQGRWWSRKSQVSQNVLAAVNFEGLFVYVLAGAEGSIHDASLLRIAFAEEEEWKLKVPRGRFYLADAGFNAQEGILTPFTGHMYHLREFRARGTLPRCQEELFNLRHSQLRSRVERAFGLWKRKYRILRGCPPEYDFDDQQLIIYATTGIYNFILTEGKDPAEQRRQLEQELTEEERDIMEESESRADEVVPRQSGPGMRRHIASWLWRQYGLDERVGRGIQEEISQEVADEDVEGSGSSDSE